MSVKYGKVESRELSTSKTSRGLVGGFKGIRATSDIPVVSRDKIEANIEKAMSEASESYLYVIKFADGKSLRITTDKDFFYRKDCVAVEQGELVNLRLVDDDLCNNETRAQKMKQQTAIQAQQCALAKRQLILAQSDREINAAGEQIRQLCQFSRN